MRDSVCAQIHCYAVHRLMGLGLSANEIDGEHAIRNGHDEIAESIEVLSEAVIFGSIRRSSPKRGVNRLAIEARLDRLDWTMSSNSRHYIRHFHRLSRHLHRACKTVVNVGMSREYRVRTNLSLVESSIEILQHDRTPRMATASAKWRMMHGNDQRQSLSAVASGLDFLQLINQKLPLGVAR